MNIVGYSDTWSVAPGERIRFMVSTCHLRYRATIVRLLGGDPRPSRLDGSRDTRAAWIFEGVQPGPIGDDGLVMGGAGGLEVDRLDLELGTPPHALLLASARGFSDSYQHVVEEVVSSDSRQGGTVNPLVRGDMVFYELPRGGAVFSVGSISWCGALLVDGGDNAVSRITENVLRRFAAEAPVHDHAAQLVEAA